MNQTVLITGAAGTIGTKLRHHLDQRFSLRLIDIEPAGDPQIRQADLSKWDNWIGEFENLETVIHLAAVSSPDSDWKDLIGANIDATINVLTAAAHGGVHRIILASSNHVMGGYTDAESPISTRYPPKPGRPLGNGSEEINSIAYGSSKLFCERLGKCLSEIHALSVIAVRLGWVPRLGEGMPNAHTPSWLQRIWLSDGDLCNLIECCITANLNRSFEIINGMSRNHGDHWDLESAYRCVGYKPQDGLDAGGCPVKGAADD